MVRWGTRLKGILGVLVLAILLPLVTRTAVAAESGTPLMLAVGQGELLHLSRPAASVFVSNPEIADIQVPSQNAIFVLGKKMGSTTLYAIDASDQTILKTEISVTHNLVELERMLRQRYPDYRLTLTSAPGSLMVGGIVNQAEDVNGVASTLTPLLSKDEKLINAIKVRSPTQIQLRVRFSEVSRGVIQKLGINWSSIGRSGNYLGGVMNGRDYYNDTSKTYYKPDSAWGILLGYATGGMDIEAMIEALDSEGLVTTLAEPNLTAVSGQTASFLAGGEYPIPVSQQNNTISIEFKPYGVSLSFTPTVIANDRISLKVRPEVSALDWSNAVTLDGTKVPAISVRRVDTSIELASGQSFAIGGLLQDNMSDALSRMPGLGNLPVLGKLFSSQNYENRRSELVVIVTAYLVRPTDGTGLHTPAESLRPANDVEYIAHSRLGSDPLAAKSIRLVGNAGFSY
ncbi:type II and III secretion system protein family protein [Magnetospirillum fulvum]|uniref:Type II/III secretion system protein n=1 Tax=Magnetospirillum fulvum MGU-K5 TaxID=1316936 RepID=S9TFV9_MAGFU|nr:type II and III secretion system protein family protein [Magnetospirillum fulvum]EPY01131.1 type II/III secretion system protein [Magnetospirillum fulvum MGU-K5]